MHSQIQNRSTPQAQARALAPKNTTESLRDLTPEELRQVTGGLKVIAIISVLIG
jgi:hypothetical protein